MTHSASERDRGWAGKEKGVARVMTGRSSAPSAPSTVVGLAALLSNLHVGRWARDPSPGLVSLVSYIRYRTILRGAGEDPSRQRWIEKGKTGDWVTKMEMDLEIVAPLAVFVGAGRVGRALYHE